MLDMTESYYIIMIRSYHKFNLSSLSYQIQQCDVKSTTREGKQLRPYVLSVCRSKLGGIGSVASYLIGEY